MIEKLRQVEWFKWNPNSDLIVVFLTGAWMTAAYYTMTHSTMWALQLFVFTLLTNVGVNVLLPTWWVLRHRKQPLSELGITTRLWLPSLFISLVLASSAWFRLWPLVDGTEWIPHLLYNTILLWEPFFVYSWVQLRCERALGVLPGILLAGVALAVYHIGTYPPQFVLRLFVVGVVYGVFFRLTRNLLVLWPLAWGASAALGTAEGGFLFTQWGLIPLYTVVLIVQVIFIAYMGRRQAKTGVT